MKAKEIRALARAKAVSLGRNRDWLEADQGPGLEATLLESVLLGLVHFDCLYPGNFGYLADAILQFGNR